MKLAGPVDIRSPILSARLLPRGAALIDLRFSGSARNLVLGFADPADHTRLAIYAGSLVGPVANRVRGGRVKIDGTGYQMPLNEAGRTTLHSGPDGLHAQDWEVMERTDDRVGFACTLPDGLNGLPGTRHITASYRLAGATLTLEITATTDHATPINIAAHPYWNLDGCADVSGHTLQLAADRYLPTDAANLPTGEIASASGTLFDFATPARVPLDPALDVNFCLHDQMRTVPAHAATLTGADGTCLRIDTTCPGLQVYNGAFLPSDTGVAMADAPPLAPYAGIALEPQHWPDAPHHGHFPTIVLQPGAPYRQVTTYTLSTV